MRSETFDILAAAAAAGKWAKRSPTQGELMNAEILDILSAVQVDLAAIEKSPAHVARVRRINLLLGRVRELIDPKEGEVGE